MIHWILLCYRRELDFLIFSPVTWYIFSFNFFCGQSVLILIINTIYYIFHASCCVGSVMMCDSGLHFPTVPYNMYIDYTRILLWCWFGW